MENITADIGMQIKQLKSVWMGGVINMSTSYSIYRFAKPTKLELAKIDYFSECDSFPVYDADGDQTGEYIRLFRSIDEGVANIINSKFVRVLVLPEKVTDYERLFRAIGFDENAIVKNKIYIKTGNTMEYTDGEQVKRIRYDDLRSYELTVQTECIAVKMECLWDSEDANCYLDKKRVFEYIPALQEYSYVPVSNNILAKAEIPFLIFERNKGKCFIRKY